MAGALPTPNSTNAATTYAQITAALAVATASLLPTITVNGITVDRAKYVADLLAAQEKALKAMQTAAGPWTDTSNVGR